MYHKYFGLEEQAFSIAVNPRYLYMSQQHKEALAHLLYGVREGGFVMLTGEVGTGKTTIIRCLLEQLPENTEIAIILNPMANIQELLCTICDEFGVAYPDENPSNKTLTDALQQHLLDNHQAGKNTILLIDEAQLLTPEVLEQVRLLTNLETSTKKLLQIILVGQPELNELLAQPRLRQLSQRITARFHLTPLTVEETDRYIRHRLSVAGMPEDRYPFSPKIVRLIHQFSGGIPRMINVVCERALVGAYGHNKSQVDNQILDLAKREVEGNRASPSSKSNLSPQMTYIALSAATFFGLGVMVFLLKLIFSNPAPEASVANIAPQTISQAPIMAVTPPQAPAPANKNTASGASSSSTQADSQPSSEQNPIATQTHSSAHFDIRNSLKAQAVLFEFLEFDINTDSPPCWQLNSLAHQCGKTKFDTWEDVAELNRPMVLSLITTDKFSSHAVLVGIQEKYALLVDEQRNRQVVALDELGPLWTGEVFYAWRKPKGFTKPLSYGDRNEAIAEIAEQFALLDSQPSPLTSGRFNKALRDRIKIFQREHQLDDDGILGERTIMKLNETLGLSATLNNEFL
ncbi:MAG: AAA family ATPase [Agarilytica sp.]